MRIALGWWSVSALALGLNVLIAGCSGSPTEGNSRGRVTTDVAPGIVLVDVLEGGEPEHYWQYQVEPASGTVEIIREEAFEDHTRRNIPRNYNRPAGSIQTCSQNPRADSPSGEYVAYCKSSSSPDFYVENKTSHELYHWSGKGIRGFAWSPNSNSVAILAVSGTVGLRPRELLSLLSGHPVSHDTVFLEILDTRSGRVTEYLVRRDVISPFTRILSWSE